jgi:hypothetical protein
MPYGRESEFPLVDFDAKLVELIDRTDRYVCDYIRTFYALVHPNKLKLVRNHLALAQKSLIVAYLKEFHKEIPYRHNYGVTHHLKRGTKPFIEWTNLHAREYRLLIQEIETLHLQMGELGCNFWSFIALERAVMEVQFALCELKRVKKLTEREVKNHVHPSNQSTTDQVGIPSSG